MPPEVATRGHVHAGPERLAHLVCIGVLNDILLVGVGVGVGVNDLKGLLRLEVPDNEEAGEHGGEKDQNEPERTHLLSTR